MEAEPAPSVVRPLQRAFRRLCQAGTGILKTVRRQVLKQALPLGVSRLKHPMAEILPRAQSSTFPFDTHMLGPTSGDGPSVVLPPLPNPPQELGRVDPFHEQHMV